MTSPRRLPPFDSDAYDRQIKQERRARAAEATRNVTPSRTPATRGLPKPRQDSSGRWKAQVVHRGVRHRATFDTRAEAEQFIQQIKGGA